MPTKKSDLFSITFRPTYEEFTKYSDLLMIRIKENYSKYVLTKEKGKGSVVNHYQMFITTLKEVRADNFRNTFKKKIMKDIILQNYNVALKIKPVITNKSSVVGYSLKEYNGIDEKNVIYKGYTLDNLLSLQDEYKELSKTNKIRIDRCRINIKNLPNLTQNYYQLHKDNYDIDTIDGFQLLFTETDIKTILNDMANDGYYLLPIFTNRKILSDLLNYTVDFFNKSIDIDDYLD